MNNGLHLNSRSKPLESLAESIASISVAGSPIKFQSSIKNLGVYLDYRMSFDIGKFPKLAKPITFTFVHCTTFDLPSPLRLVRR